jgi:hypothetical protein
MKKLIFACLALLSFLAACSGGATQPASTAILTVTSATTQKTYTQAQLQSLSKSEASFNNVTYVGVPLANLLQDAGFDPGAVQSVKAIASDGFSATYDSSFFTRPDVLVAYTRKDGPLTGDDGAFRMVLPGEEGKFNVRMLVELNVTQ